LKRRLEIIDIDLRAYFDIGTKQTVS